MFFFKQKTAYEMRISDWSSDLCSSDLTARPRDDEEVREPGHGETEERARPGVPLVAERLPVPPADIDREQRAGHGVETGRENQRIEGIVAVRRPHAFGGDRLDRSRANIDERDILAVEGFIIVGVDADALDRTSTRLNSSHSCA